MIVIENILDVKIDYVFKKLFGREETKSVTKELVGSILEEEITEIDLEQNPILE